VVPSDEDELLSFWEPYIVITPGCMGNAVARGTLARSLMGELGPQGDGVDRGH
jgi:hypothetical protein